MNTTQLPPPAHQGDLPPARRPSTVVLWLLGLLFVVAIGAVLKAGAVVVVPVVFALLITLIMTPLHDNLQARLPTALTWLASIAIMAILLAIIAVFLSALIFAAQQVLDKVPDFSTQLDQLLQGRDENGEALLSDRLREVWNQMGGQIGGWIVDRISGLSTMVASMTGGFVAAMAIVFFLVLLALNETAAWRGKIAAIWPGEGRDRWQTALATIAHRLRVFLLVRTGVGVLQAGLYTGWLAIFGIDLLLVWAVLTFILTYIPNIGSIISGSLPSLYALVTQDIGTALAVAGGILVIEQVVGNFIDPRLLGREILLSPVMILISLLIWGWIWGAAGAFLATPILLTLLIAFNTISALRPIALALSNQSDPDRLDRLLAEGGR